MSASREDNQVIVPLRKPYIDARGSIQNLLDLPIGSVALITSKKGAVRANHYHKTDFHYCYLISGSMIYYHRPAGSKEPPKEWAIKAGMLFYTPPMYEHAMRFTEDSTFITMARNSRTMEHYEDDTVRVPLIDP